MRKIIISFCFLLAALAVKAQSVSGIRIDGGDAPILVYFGGNQMCLPTTTCFVANLKSGYYTIEVYETRFTRAGERVWKGQRIYNERVYFDGSGVKDIFVDSRDDNNYRPGRPNQGEGYPDYDRHGGVMNPQLFDVFFNKLKNEPFSSDRLNLLETTLTTAYFTSAQCLRIVNLYTFDDDKMKIMKMMYPRIVDKQAFFTVISTLTFSSGKDEMAQFVKSYGDRRR